MHKKIEKEWNGGAIVSLIYLIIYALFLIPLNMISSFAINGKTVVFQCNKGKKFESKKKAIIYKLNGKKINQNLIKVIESIDIK